MDIQQQTEKRVLEVRSAAWLSFPDLCLHCGRGRTKMREWTARKDFPRASKPDEKADPLWNKAKVDAWMEAHELEAVGD